MNADYEKALVEWRNEMDENLRRNYSWLSLAGLFWLEQGDNKVGSADTCSILLPQRAPKLLGKFTLTGNQVSFTAGENAKLRLNNNEEVHPDQILKADVSGKPDQLFVDDIKMIVISRAGNSAIRVWDPQKSTRRNFPGRSWYKVNSAFRVQAQIEKLNPVKVVLVEDILGFQHESQIDAVLHFKINNKAFQLDAQKLDSGAFYVIFKDQTATDSSYPTGRYMVTERADNKSVFIDFNRAYNPPCAFTEHATCPLPRPENIIDVRIEAGEKYSNS